MFCPKSSVVSGSRSPSSPAASQALLLLIETKEESPCSDNLLVTPSLTGAFHLKKKNFLLLLPWRQPQKLAGSPKDLKCERKEQQDYIVNFLSCRTILFSPTRFVSDARFIRGFQYLIACVHRLNIWMLNKIELEWFYIPTKTYLGALEIRQTSWLMQFIRDPDPSWWYVILEATGLDETVTSFKLQNVKSL